MLYALFFILLALCVVDITVSGMAVKLGAKEVGVIFLVLGDFSLMCWFKAVLTFVVGAGFVRYKRKDLLWVGVIMYSVIAVYGVAVLLFQKYWS